MPAWDFGNPARLLRQSWKTADALAQELYTMFTVKQVPEAPAKAPEEAKAAPASEPAEGRAKPSSEPVPGNPSIRRSTTVEAPKAIVPPPIPTSEKAPNDVLTDEEYHARIKNANPIGNIFTLGKKHSPGASLVGQAVSKGNGGFVTTLYPDGPGGEPGDTVTVLVPVLDSSEDLSGEWLYGILLVTDANGRDYYYFQPPVWLD